MSKDKTFTITFHRWNCKPDVEYAFPEQSTIISATPKGEGTVGGLHYIVDWYEEKP